MKPVEPPAERSATRPAGHSADVPGVKTFVIEAVVGLAIALLLLWVAVAAVTDVPFVYQGL